MLIIYREKLLKNLRATQSSTKFEQYTFLIFYDFYE